MISGEFKFQNCIHRSQTEETVEIAGCGSCGTTVKTTDTGFRCSLRKMILNPQNRAQICQFCWVGEFLDESGNPQKFKFI